MKQGKAIDVVLGINVTGQLIEAVLLQQDEDHVQVLRRFIRQRAQAMSTAGSFSQALPGLLDGDAADYSFDMGGGSTAAAADVTFLASEFGGDQKPKEKAPAQPGGAPQGQAATFTAQLAEILEECRKAGFEAPRLAFCMAPPEVSYTELTVTAPGKKGGKKPEDGVSRRQLLELLARQRQAPFDAGRTAFVPLAPVADQPRYVALVPEPSEPVRPTLEALTAQQRPLPPVRLLDAELSVYARLARRMIRPNPASGERPVHNTALVRIGVEDTLILFFTGTELRHYERLRSLSTYDSPDTICSRVLLQQDEQKIGEVQHMLVLSEERGDQFLSVFRRFYAEATVETVQDALGALGVRPPRGAEGLSPGAVPAVAAGLRLLQDWDQEDPDFTVHLLPRKMQHEGKKLALAWHTGAMLLVLAAVTVLVSWRYAGQQAEINRQREAMRQSPVELLVDNPALLKVRVDSLQAAYVKYTHALAVIDSLLIGSDRWTRLHEQITGTTREVGGLWLKAMEPVGSGSIRIEGSATTRTRVAQFARRHEGSIEKVSSVEVEHERRDVQLYDFVVVVPVPGEIPRVARYLQEVSADHIREAAVDSVPAAYEAVPEAVPPPMPR